MKNIILIFALIANVASAQYMHFRIIPDHDHNMLSSSDNDSVEWVVFIDDLYEPSETPDFKPLREAECIFDSRLYCPELQNVHTRYSSPAATQQV